MNVSMRSLAIILGVLFLLPAAAFADAYHTADFSGQLGSSPNIKAPFAGNGFNPGGAVTGSFVYDDNLIPSSGTGFVNVFFSSFPDIAQIPSSTALDLSRFYYRSDPGEWLSLPAGTCDRLLNGKATPEKAQ